MADENEQTATVDTNEQLKTVSEEKGAPETKPDLDALLNEYEEQTGTTEQKDDKPDETAKRLERLEAEVADRSYREDLGKVVNAVRGDFSTDEIDDEFIDTWVNAEAKKDSRVANAWMKRHDDPKKFERVVAGLANKFAEKYAKLHKRDEDATVEREAVASAVRRQGNKGSEGKAPELGKMTDAQLREHTEKEYGFSV